MANPFVSESNEAMNIPISVHIRIDKGLKSIGKILPASLLFASLLAACAVGQAAEYDTIPTLPASKVLPPKLLQNKNFRIQDGIKAVDGLYKFRVAGKWDTFEVLGEAMLRLRLKEMDASIALAKTSAVSVAGKAAGEAALSSVKDLGKAVAHPVETAKALPGGVMRMFKGTVWDVKDVAVAAGRGANEIAKGGPDSGKKSVLSKDASELARRYTKVSKKHRELAQKYGVDPYSTNPILQRELHRLGIVAQAADVGANLIVPVLPGALGLVAKASDIAYKKDWREVFEHNARIMRNLGVSEKDIHSFQYSEVITPTTQALIVTMLDAIKSAKHRNYVIQQAAQLETESEALFFTESIMLAEWYNRNRRPLKEFLRTTLVPAAITHKGNVVLFTAVDAAYWTKPNEKLVRELSALYGEQSGKELIAADFVSPRFEQHMATLGWSIESRLRSKYEVEIPWGAQDE